MASGHVNRTKGRTHGYTDQPAGREKILANSEPSKHGTTERSVFASAPQIGSVWPRSRRCSHWWSSY